IGYMTGSALAARMVVNLGLDGVLGIGGRGSAGGGCGRVARGPMGPAPVPSGVRPGSGLPGRRRRGVPRGVARAPAPCRERAARALIGFVQQSIAALCGGVVGSLLGRSAWPLAVAVAAMGCATLLLWLATQRVRCAGAKH